MENVILMADRAAQFCDRSKAGARGTRVKAFVDAQVRLQVLVEVSDRAGPKLAHQHFGSGHFVFAESVENTHAVRWPIILRSRTNGRNAGYFLYCVGCGPFSSVSRSQIQPSRV